MLRISDFFSPIELSGLGAGTSKPNVITLLIEIFCLIQKTLFFKIAKPVEFLKRFWHGKIKEKFTSYFISPILTIFEVYCAVGLHIHVVIQCVILHPALELLQLSHLKLCTYL